jgi:hypothetical protein
MIAKLKLRRIGHYALIVVASLWVLFEEWVWDYFTALIARLAKLEAIQRVEAVIARQNRYVLFGLFAVPLLIMIPFKLYSFYLMGTGRAYQGLAVLITAKALGTALVTRLFVISKDKLLSVGLFAVCYHWVMAKKQWLHDQLEQIAWLQTLRQAIKSASRRVKDKIAALKSAGSGGVFSRLASIRAFIKKRLHKEPMP